MSKKMLKFVKLNQETPVKRHTDSRKNDFNEIYRRANFSEGQFFYREKHTRNIPRHIPLGSGSAQGHIRTPE